MTNKELIQEYLKNNDITKLPTGIATGAVMNPLTRK